MATETRRKHLPPGHSTELSSAMLNDLLNDTLDPGYRAAAERHREKRWWDAPLVWLGSLLVGLLLVVAYQQSHLAAPAREAAQQELITRIHRLQDANTTAGAQAKALSSQVAALRDAQLATVPGDATAVKNAEIASGAIAVTGPGMQVQLDEPPAPTTSANSRPGTTPQTDVAVITDSDVRLVVNALWASGAEAIAVNGLRLTETSFIRVAGESIQVDFQPISAPYTINAIGDSNALQVGFAESAIAQQLQTMTAVEGITFHFTGKSGLKLPSVTVGQPRYAVRGTLLQPTQPAKTAQPTPSPTETR